MGGPQLWDCGRQVEPQVPAQVGIRLERVHCWEPFTLQPCPSSQRCPRHQGSQPQHTGTAHPAAVLGPSSGSLCGKVEAANLTQAHAFQVPTWGSWGGATTRTSAGGRQHRVFWLGARRPDRLLIARTDRRSREG